MGPEVLTMGRVSVDLYPDQVGVRLRDVTTFRKTLGGSPTNVAVAAARLGRTAAVVTKVGDDEFGAFVRESLTRFGVDPSRVGTRAELRTPLAFCEIHPPDHFPLLFYREPVAPDLMLEPWELDAEAIRAAGIFWATGTGLSREPSRSTTLDAFTVRGRRQHTIFDLDFRPTLWHPADDPAPLYREALRRATVAIGNLAEVAVAVGVCEPEEAASRLLDAGPELAVVKLGPAGVLAATPERTMRIPALEIEVVNGLGAGDAFGGGLCHGLLAGWELERTIRFANAAGGLVAGRMGCADDMPTAEEVEAALCSG